MNNIVPQLKINFLPSFPKATGEDLKISHYFDAECLVENNPVINYLWYIKYSRDNGLNWENPILLETTTVNTYSISLSSNIIPFDSSYQIGVRVENANGFSEIVYSEIRYFLSDITSLKFPHLILSDYIVGDNYEKVPEPYFRRSIQYTWNEENKSETFYLTTQAEEKLTEKTDKFLVYTEQHLPWYSLLKHLPYLNYKIYYKENGILINKPIAQGEITKTRPYLHNFYNFSKVNGNIKVSLVLEIFDIEGPNQQKIILDNNSYLIKARTPYCTPDSFEIIYGVKDISAFHPLVLTDSFHIKMSNPLLYNNIYAKTLKYSVRINNVDAPILLSGQFSNPQSATLDIVINSSENNKVILSQSLIGKNQNLNERFNNVPVFLILEDQYGLIATYEFPFSQQLNIEYREPPIFSDKTFKIGIDYIYPQDSQITWAKEDVFANATSEKIINKNEYLIASFNAANDLNLNEKIFYQLTLLSSTDKINYDIENVSYWTTLDSLQSFSSSFLLEGEKYGMPNQKVAFLKITSLDIKKYFKIEIKSFNIENNDFNQRIWGNKIVSETYIVGCPTSIPIITAKFAPNLQKSNNKWIASTLTDQGLMYSISLPPEYDKYPSFERSIKYTFKNNPEEYKPEAKIILQYGLNTDIPEADSPSTEQIVVKHSFVNRQLEDQITRDITQSTFSRLFFRIKLVITAGKYYEEGAIKTKTYTSYSNVVIYYPAGPTILQRYHSLGINPGEPKENEVFAINPFDAKTRITFNGRDSRDPGNIKDTFILFDLENGILQVNDEKGFDFIATTKDIDDIFSP